MPPEDDQTCPLCGGRLEEGSWMDALGRHFETCPSTRTAAEAALAWRSR